MTTASEIAKHAAELVSGDRAATHGDKTLNHANIARLWNAYLGCQMRDWNPMLTPRDVALMMALLKVARTSLGAHNPDDYVDAVGYAAIAGEIAEGEHAVGEPRVVCVAAPGPDALDAAIAQINEASRVEAEARTTQQERELKSALAPGSTRREVTSEYVTGAERIRTQTLDARAADAIQRRMEAEGDMEP